MKLIDIFRKAKRVFSRKSWIQSEYYEYKEDFNLDNTAFCHPENPESTKKLSKHMTGCCLAGALGLACENKKDYNKAYKYLNKLMLIKLDMSDGSRMGIVTYNDEVAQSVDDIKSVLQEAIEALKKKGAV